jgi:uncharacterized protein (DUF1810 family)
VSLDRFLDAQDRVWPDVLAELRAGRKTSHWMWFVFPQIAGLGTSPTSVHYAIADADEARAYLEHPVLGDRLRECAEVLLGLKDRSARAVFGDVDALKLRSSMTLFSRVADDALFQAVLDRYFEGRPDRATLERGI